MDIFKVLESVKEVPTSTKLKCWVFEVNNSYYHVAECSGYRIPDHTSIWTSSRSGKRISKEPIFTVQIKDYKKCITKFFESLEN
jgi:hypothetical protein